MTIREQAITVAQVTGIACVGAAVLVAFALTSQLWFVAGVASGMFIALAIITGLNYELAQRSN